MLAPRGGVHPPLATPIHDAIKTMRVWQSRQCSWHAGNTLAQFGSLSAGTTTPSTLKTVKTLRADSVTECSSAAPQCSRYLIASNCRAHRSRVSDKCACVVCGPRGKACVCSHSVYSSLLFSSHGITLRLGRRRRVGDRQRCLSGAVRAPVSRLQGSTSRGYITAPTRPDVIIARFALLCFVLTQLQYID